MNKDMIELTNNELWLLAIVPPIYFHKEKTMLAAKLAQSILRDRYNEQTRIT